MVKQVSARVMQLRVLWLERAPEKRTRNDVLEFYCWLEKNHPELLRRGHGDRYEYLQAELSLNIRD
jgi:hypothetical protein